MNPLKNLEQLGQSPWMDFISRSMIGSGGLARMIEEDGVKGVTSNPSIFDKAISSGSDYDEGIKTAVQDGITTPEAVFEQLAVKDIQDACDALKGVYERTAGVDGYVSLEVSPSLAYDSTGTLAAAKRLFAIVARPNVMIKIPATKQGLYAIEAATAAGININVTLIFSIERYLEVMNAYLGGLEALAVAGGDLKKVASVASFFVSRIDSAVDKALPQDSPLRGKIAVANAKTAYALFQKVFAAKRFQALAKKGARVQRPLWASTSSKDPSLSDTYYVDSLIGKDTVNTIPPATWDAFRDHGTAAETVTLGVEDAKRSIEALKKSGIDLAIIAGKLEADGVKAFQDSFMALLHHLEGKISAFAAVLPPPDGVVSRIWKKDSSLWTESQNGRTIIDSSLGWLNAPENMSSKLPELVSFADELRAEGFEAVVVLGMGGSSLAPELFRRCFSPRPGYPSLRVLDSTEPETLEAVLSASNPEKTLFIVASKSGTTTEPSRFFEECWSRLPRGANFAAITDPGTSLESLAHERGFRRCFVNDPNVGGRFSALTFFGLVPAAAAGIDVAILLEAAKAMASACADPGENNPGLDLGNWIADRHAEGKDKLSLIVDPRLDGLGLWLEQLIAESTGKGGVGVVPIADEPKAELACYGADRAFVYVSLGGGDNSSFIDSLQDSGHPVYEIRVAGPIALGAEFFRWEFATAVLGTRLGINPFDQPDVQSAKDMTKSLLSRLEETGSLPMPVEDFSNEFFSGSFSPVGRADSLESFWSLARKGDYAAVLAFLPSGGVLDSSVASLRAAVVERLRVACQFGYGPRYLHSTGQLHKGGADNGLFVVLVRDEGNSPFALLARAQGLGDFEALSRAGRRAVLLRVKGDPATALERIRESVLSSNTAAV